MTSKNSKQALRLPVENRVLPLNEPLQDFTVTVRSGVPYPLMRMLSEMRVMDGQDVLPEDVDAILDRLFALLETRIVEWDLVDGAGDPLPPTAEGLHTLADIDFNFIGTVTATIVAGVGEIPLPTKPE